MASTELPIIRVTEIGEFIRHNSCERRLKLGLNKRREARRLPFAERLFNALDPVLQEAGQVREAEWERSLRDGYGFKNLNDGLSGDQQMEWSVFKSALENIPTNQNAYAREVELSGEIGSFQIEGRIDFIVITWKNDEPILRLVECKASRKDRTYHHVQVALYTLILKDLISSEGLSISSSEVVPQNIESVVARVDESTNEGQPILQLEPLELDLVSADIKRLLESDGTLSRITATNLDDLEYKLEPKCDGCVFNVDCFPEAARLRRLELIGLDPTDIRALKAENINTIDCLANINLSGDQAKRIKANPGFSGGLDIAVAKAKARITTLPHGSAPPDGYQVEALPNRWSSQLPLHEINNMRLVRVYLSIDYDYTENRLGALSAHITSSKGMLHTGFEEVNGNWTPCPEIIEKKEQSGEIVSQPVQGIDVIRFKTSRWSGRLEEDNGSERELIQGFIHELIDGIARTANSDYAPIHFYVWSRSEISHLVEGCTRGGSNLLAHIKELLGCRESLEQLLFSSVGEEVNNRYALGWTSRGLASVSSLRWFGDIYHWSRSIGGEKIDIDRIFAQDIFDFKTDLYLNPDNSWAQSESSIATRHKFEIRSRFYDSLPAPYWHSVWRTLPDPDDNSLPQNVCNAIRRYNEAAAPGRLRSYLQARLHALRWIEEHVKFKNSDITKPLLQISNLTQFELGINDVSASALNFLQLEQHIRVSQWVSMHLVAPSNRVISGKTIPLKDVRAVENNKLIGQIDIAIYDIDIEELSSRATLYEGSFARLIPYSGNPENPQSVAQLYRAGSTCIIDEINWDKGEVRLSVVPIRIQNADQYRLASHNYTEGETLDFGTLDENPSDFVAHRVGTRLNETNSEVYRWFDPIAPRLPEKSPLGIEHRGLLNSTLQDIRFNNGHSLSDDQALSILDGLDTAVQLLQGPPGTGKTQTTAVAILIRALQELSVGNIVLVVGNTHTAVDNLLLRISDVLENVTDAVVRKGLNMPGISLAKVHSSDDEEGMPDPIHNFRAIACTNEIKKQIKNSVLILGGTTSALLKMAKGLEGKKTYSDGFFSDLLVVDEASMMVFPNFLAMTSLVNGNGKIMLAGDHRQLAPILAHDWEREDRPPVVLYQPFVSAYDAVLGLLRHPSINDASVKRSALEYTYRLPPLVRNLIAQLYRRDSIELRGPSQQDIIPVDNSDNDWKDLWGGSGLFLVVHNERVSRKSNQLETTVIRNILEAGNNLDEDSVAVITPHRAQRTLLKDELKEFEKVCPVIDTVERLQGDQKPTIIISATVSDPIAIASSVEFILDLNRSNVAFSRVQTRLIVVCSETLLNHMAPEIEHYESAVLWKSLRAICNNKLKHITLDSHKIDIFSPNELELRELDI